MIGFDVLGEDACNDLHELATATPFRVIVLEWSAHDGSLYLSTLDFTPNEIHLTRSRWDAYQRKDIARLSVSYPNAQDLYEQLRRYAIVHSDNPIPSGERRQNARTIGIGTNWHTRSIGSEIDLLGIARVVTYDMSFRDHPAILKPAINLGERNAVDWLFLQIQLIEEYIQNLTTPVDH